MAPILLPAAICFAANETTSAYGVLLVFLAGCASHTAPGTSPTSREVAASAKPSVRAHLEFLASDALNGRGSGTRDEQIAAEYVGAQFRRLGFEAGRHRRQLRADGRDRARAPPPASRRSRSASSLKWTLRQGIRGARWSVSAPDRGTAAADQRRGDRRSARRRRVSRGGEPRTLAARAVQAGAAAVFMRRNADAGAMGRRRPGGRRRSARGSSGIPPASQTRPTIVSLNADACRRACAASRTAPRCASTRPPASRRQTYTYNAVGILAGHRPVRRSDPDHARTSITSAAARPCQGAGQDLQRRRRRRVGDGGGDGDRRGPGEAEGAEADDHLYLFRQRGSRAATARRTSGRCRRCRSRRWWPIVQFEMIGRPDPKVPPKTLWLTGYERSDLGPTLAAQRRAPGRRTRIPR